MRASMVVADYIKFFASGDTHNGISLEREYP